MLYKVLEIFDNIVWKEHCFTSEEEQLKFFNTKNDIHKNSQYTKFKLATVDEKGKEVVEW